MQFALTLPINGEVQRRVTKSLKLKNTSCKISFLSVTTTVGVSPLPLCNIIRAKKLRKKGNRVRERKEEPEEAGCGSATVVPATTVVQTPGSPPQPITTTAANRCGAA
ncbi:hypothetical protein SESBI_00948 [Sesbania bispinosa]|nr:hypothetical protein SESBI_00948 [Sesbania bispinosa]